MGDDKAGSQDGIAARIASDEISGISSIRPRPLQNGIYAHFLLVDIASPVREIRGVPRYLPVKETPTFLGRNEKVQILLDDPWTVDLWHARVDLRESDERALFVLYAVEKAKVTVNGEIVGNDGCPLKSEDIVQIGSAQLIFFQRDMRIR